MNKHMQTHLSVPNKGFNLVELITTLTVITVAISYAAPFIKDAARKMEANHFYPNMRTILLGARSQATLGLADVLLCGSIDRQTCNADWTNGILVFMDIDGNRLYDPSVDSLYEYINLNLHYGRIVVKASRGNTKVWFKQNSGNSLGYYGSNILLW